MTVADKVQDVLFRCYLSMERIMCRLDVDGHPAGEDLRDAMDEPWGHLTDAQRAELNARGPMLDPQGYAVGPRAAISAEEGDAKAKGD